MVKIKEAEIEFKKMELNDHYILTMVILFDSQLLQPLTEYVNNSRVKFLSYHTGHSNFGYSDMKLKIKAYHEISIDDFQELYNNQDNPNYQLMFTNHKDPVISFLAELLVKFN